MIASRVKRMAEERGDGSTMGESHIGDQKEKDCISTTVVWEKLEED